MIALVPIPYSNRRKSPDGNFPKDPSSPLWNDLTGDKTIYFNDTDIFESEIRIVRTNLIFHEIGFVRTNFIFHTTKIAPVTPPYWSVALLPFQDLTSAVGLEIYRTLDFKKDAVTGMLNTRRNAIVTNLHIWSSKIPCNSTTTVWFWFQSKNTHALPSDPQRQGLILEKVQSHLLFTKYRLQYQPWSLQWPLCCLR